MRLCVSNIKCVSLRVAQTACLLTTIFLVATATAGAASSKLLFASEFGREVDATTNADICTAKSGDTCVNGTESSAAGGFRGPQSLAFSPKTGTVYVADTANARVQEFTTGGEFMLMFGWNVNASKVKEGAPQAQRNICTKTEIEAGAECVAGETGEQAGQMYGPFDVTADPATGNVYILDLFNKRIDVFTSGGAFLFMIGGNVNKTAVGKGGTESERNLCSSESGDECQAGEFATTGPAHGAFRTYPVEFKGNLLAFGGPQDLLYASDEGRVDTFTAAGEWKGEIPLAALSTTANPNVLAVNPSGDIFVAAEEPEGSEHQNGGIHELDPTGTPVPGFTASAAGKTTRIVQALTYDASAGHLAAVEHVVGTALSSGVGSLYDDTGEMLSSFEPPNEFYGTTGISFDNQHALYATGAANLVDVFVPVPVPVPVTEACKNVTTTGFTLAGEVNPENSLENPTAARAWFEYRSSRAAQLATPFQTLPVGSAFVPVTAALSGLAPNETYTYRILAEGGTDPGQPEEGQEISCLTKAVAPAIEGETETAYVTDTSATMFGELNPENAETEYYFEYGPCNEIEETMVCDMGAKTTVLKSSAYGKVGVALKADGLQPATLYRYRMVAIGHNRNLTETHKSFGEEAEFTTMAAPSPAAVSEAPSNIGLTGATLEGVVNPDGAQATYAFEVGLNTSTGVVFSSVTQGATGAGSGFEHESFTVRGLQPGTNYMYRIMVVSAYGVSYGAPIPFTTAGLPAIVSAPVAPSLLPVPALNFPKSAKSPNATQKLRKALAVCRKKHAKRRRACERGARRLYGPKHNKKP
jgi:hypothetical protein